MTQADLIQHVEDLGYSLPVICSVGSRAFSYETSESDLDYVVYSRSIHEFSVEKYGECDLWFVPYSYIPFEGRESYIHWPDLANIVYCGSPEFETYVSNHLSEILTADIPRVYSTLAEIAYDPTFYSDPRAAKSIAVSVLRTANVLERYRSTGVLSFTVDDSYEANMRKMKLDLIPPVECARYTNGLFSSDSKQYFTNLPVNDEVISALKSARDTYLGGL